MPSIRYLSPPSLWYRKCPLNLLTNFDISEELLGLSVWLACEYHPFHNGIPVLVNLYSISGLSGSTPAKANSTPTVVMNLARFSASFSKYTSGNCIPMA